MYKGQYSSDNLAYPSTYPLLNPVATLFVITMSEPKVLSLAVVLYPGINIVDYQGPMELLETAGTKSRMGALVTSLPGVPKPKVKFETEYLAETHDPITPMAGARVLPTKTFSEVASNQFDIILVPGGDNTRPGEPSKALADFIRGQASGAQYILSVCTGSWILAGLGLLDGKRATTNKSYFNEIKKTTSPSIEWVPKARWVVDGKFWTSSGVTAGQDMGHEFLKTVAGAEFAIVAKNTMELRATNADDDEFADVFGLV
ncbi:unnamed protein product [Rhizoctonia solani]|uniref:DJ-1/PfpI domain-containing protein n=1 Tax=Rhizoctonia solani TaxID=456999 RepID=A0A8H3GXM5_9AGAM|nr:unnamed protein product [Rhizoctonia solani]